jgi:hypothetical protein
MNSSRKKEGRLLKFEGKDGKHRKKKKKKNLLSRQGPSPLVCPIFFFSLALGGAVPHPLPR